MGKGFNHKKYHAEFIPQIRQCIVTAGKDDIPHVIIFTGNRDGLDDETGLAGDAERAGVVLEPEVLNGYDHPDYQADETGFALDFAKAVSSPAVTILYDVYHMQLFPEGQREQVLAEWENDDAARSLRMARTRKAKIVYYGYSDDGERYDLENDPNEFMNLYNNPDYADLQTEMMDRPQEEYLRRRPKVRNPGGW